MEALVKQRQIEIESSIQREEAALSAITESLESADLMTKQMENILANFGSRLTKLEEAVIPIHKQTKDLQRLQDNIANVLGAIDNVVDYHHVAKRQKDTISKGILTDLSVYIRSLKEVEAAVAFFSANNPDSPELNRVKALLKTGTKKMEDYFIELMKRNSKVPAPETVLEMLDENNNYEKANIPRIDSSEGPRPIPVAQFEPAIMVEVKKVANWLSNDANDDAYSAHYGQIRGNILHQTLHQLKAFIKDTSSLKGGGKYRKSLGRKPRRDRSREDDIEPEVEPFMRSISAFVKLSEAEVNLMKAILTEDKFSKKVFDLIVSIPLDSIKFDSEKFVRHCKECKVRKDFPGMLIVFPVVQHLKDEAPIAHNKALRHCSSDNAKVLSQIVNDIETAGAATLEYFIETIASDPSKEKPNDGNVHEAASNAFLFLEQLQQHAAVGGGMIARRESDSSSSQAQALRSFASYIERVLKAIKDNLEQKSKLYEESKALKALFLMNNYNFIIKRLRETRLLEMLPPTTCDQFDFVAKQKEYLKSWQRVANPCSTDGIDLNEHKLRDKDRDTVKRRFKDFNTELEDMVAKHQRYAVADPELRDSTRRQVKELIQPYYSVFRKTFIKKVFTTKVEKYIKYSEETMEEEIDKIFDLEA